MAFIKNILAGICKFTLCIGLSSLSLGLLVLVFVYFSGSPRDRLEMLASLEALQYEISGQAEIPSAKIAMRHENE